MHSAVGDAVRGSGPVQGQGNLFRTPAAFRYDRPWAHVGVFLAEDRQARQALDRALQVPRPAIVGDKQLSRSRLIAALVALAVRWRIDAVLTLCKRECVDEDVGLAYPRHIVIRCARYVLDHFFLD